MAIKANSPRNPKGPSKEQKDHYSATRRLDDKVKSPSSGKFGESYRAQQKATPAPGSGRGGIGSEHENVSGIKDLAVTKSHSAYAHQEHAATGMHGGGPDKQGSLLTSPTVSKHRAYANQAHAKDGKSTTELCEAEALQGETGSYMGHFRQEKYLREGHNSNGYVPMGPGMSTSKTESHSKSKKIDMEDKKEMKAGTYSKKNEE